MSVVTMVCGRASVNFIGSVAKLANAADSKSVGLITLVGSIPTVPTVPKVRFATITAAFQISSGKPLGFLSPRKAGLANHFVDALGCGMNIKLSIEYHTELGRHSNIPECCIEEWNNGRRGKDVPSDLHVQYVPCSKCVDKQSFVEIHKCSINRLECIIFWIKYERDLKTLRRLK